MSNPIGAGAKGSRRRVWLAGLGVAGACLLSLGSTLGASTAAAGLSLAPQVHATSGSMRAMTGAESQFSPSQMTRDASGPWPSVTPSSQPTLASRPRATNAGGAVTATSDDVGGAYTALPPTRIVDTRPGSGYPDAGDTLDPESTLPITVAGIAGVPTDATAVAINVTVTDASTASFLTIYPAGGTQPLVSSLNWAAGQTVPNLVIVPVGSGDEVNLYNDAGSVDVIVDLEGYFFAESADSTVGSYVALPPARICDTRPTSESGLTDACTGHTLGADGNLSVQVTGEGRVPADMSDVEAVLANVTVTNTTAASDLTVYPEGETQPNVSNLNWGPGQTLPNRVVVPINTTTGQITVFNDAGRSDVIVDVDGYFTDGTAPTGSSLYTAISPYRLIDTRSGSDYFGAGQTLGPDATLSEPLASIGSLGSNVTAVVTNVTATDTSAPSFFTVFPGPTQPNASDLNWTTGRTAANLTVATVDSDGNVSFYNDAGNADLVADVFGYFSSSATLNDNGYQTSENWSGYEEDNGTGVADDTSVTGTFTVPSLYAGDPTGDYMAEWVGIDGVANANLIQAGITEESTSPTTFGFFPWWEILPAPSVDVYSPDFTGMEPGDTFTVTISEATSTTWTIDMDDVTQSEDFTTTQTYPPSGTSETSAEWIVEAPTVEGGGGPFIAPLADYVPTTFTNLSVVGSDSEETEFVMYQGTNFVSVPSGPGEGGASFNVTYGDTIPYPPP
jgi:hypothetical protein